MDKEWIPIILSIISLLIAVIIGFITWYYQWVAKKNRDRAEYEKINIDFINCIALIEEHKEKLLNQISGNPAISDKFGKIILHFQNKYSKLLKKHDGSFFLNWHDEEIEYVILYNVFFEMEDNFIGNHQAEEINWTEIDKEKYIKYIFFRLSQKTIYKSVGGNFQFVKMKNDLLEEYDSFWRNFYKFYGGKKIENIEISDYDNIYDAKGNKIVSEKIWKNELRQIQKSLNKRIRENEKQIEAYKQSRN